MQKQQIEVCSEKNGLYKNFAKFTGKHLSLLFNKVASQHLFDRTPSGNLLEMTPLHPLNLERQITLGLTRKTCP